MFIVAITGGIASGKSTVSNVFAKNGIPVIDADKIAREIVEPGKPCWHKIRDLFGDEIFHPSKEINREALGKAVFNDRELRGKLNKITHPVIHRKIFFQVFKQFMSGRSWIVLDLPLLFETGILLDFIHKIITVSCDSETQLKRLMLRNDFVKEEAKKRIEVQMPLEKKCELSHFVIDNSGDIAATEEAALKIFHMMQESNQHWINRSKFLAIIFVAVMVVHFIDKTFSFLPKFLKF